MQEKASVSQSPPDLSSLLARSSARVATFCLFACAFYNHISSILDAKFHCWLSFAASVNINLFCLCPLRDTYQVWKLSSLYYFWLQRKWTCIVCSKFQKQWLILGCFEDPIDPYCSGKQWFTLVANSSRSWLLIIPLFLIDALAATDNSLLADAGAFQNGMHIHHHHPGK